MKEIKPNHICKNSNCRKEYYACDYCGKTLAWRSMACSLPCYAEYMKQVDAARAVNKPINAYPERIDMSPSEVIDLVVNTPIEQIKEDTLQELSEYQDSIDTIGLGATIDKINIELSTKASKSKKK